MDVVKGVRDYVTKIVADTPGMKVLLLDKDTVRCCLSSSLTLFSLSETRTLYFSLNSTHTHTHAHTHARTHTLSLYPCPPSPSPARLSSFSVVALLLSLLRIFIVSGRWAHNSHITSLMASLRSQPRSKERRERRKRQDTQEEK